jgi:hypothetical protein
LNAIVYQDLKVAELTVEILTNVLLVLPVVTQMQNAPIRLALMIAFVMTGSWELEAHVWMLMNVLLKMNFVQLNLFVQIQ